MSNKPVVAIVGRPNVGKSALFNRIVGRRVAIVEGEPGVTRDRIHAEASWTERPFTLVDTGGMDFGGDGAFAEPTLAQAKAAVDQADVLVFVVDAQTGLLPSDREVADVLRRSRKPVVLAVNKVDHPGQRDALGEFYALGLGDPVAVSAEHGRGVGDLLDRVVSHFPKHAGDAGDDDSIRVAVVGRPNVGKSSLVNLLIGEERSIVSDIPGTTRDAIDTTIERDGNRLTLIDTAGVRKRKRIDHPVERYSVLRTFRAIDRSDVCAVMLDATELVTDQDKRIAGYAHEAGKGIILVVNKWDLVDKDDKSVNRYEELIRGQLAFAQYAPILFISARTGLRALRLIELAVYVANQHALRIPTGRLNEVLERALSLRQPPSDKGKRLKIFYATQAGVKPPTFVLFVNDPELMHYSYERFIENQLREHFGFVGTPILLKLRKRNA